ncbi:uncharacterized protein LOC111049581 [Nilaparvata lugens]|uniref:uncharacterized protein LOC111049581 n=1 Tax=Nilaparvata lugens TaxID=108931 RepID=UPI000B9941FF|nr:uncharacterized protein LOC111049581 [Nilaparvata lugens]XP_039283449.1 uncharacterized protein LOC111049581 [Nilaparvata lugens]
MKYPQLFSMPEALRIWLEDELEARGIDTVYSHHILNILQHKNLKESSVHVSGIESLVDELRTKLKKFESEDETYPQKTFGSSTSAPTCSFQDTILFAETGQKFSENTLHKSGNSALATFTSAWSCPSYYERKFLKCGFGRNLSNLVVGNKEKSSGSILKKWEEENKENQASKENVGTKEKMRSRSRSTVKQQHAHKARKNMAKSLDRKDDLLKVKVTLDGSKARKLELANEPARAILSKYDREVKSIWSDDLDGCDENLPMDFQQLLESPDNTSLPMEFYKNINNKRQQMNSFIQCGTNITSSIWSTDTADMDCSAEPESLILDNNDKQQEDCSMSSLSIWDDDKQPCYPTNNQPTQQWSNGENLFADTPWQMKAAKWSDVEGTSLHIDDGGKFYSAFDDGPPQPPAPETLIDTSLSALNHNKEDSCFMEVVPNSNSNSNKVSQYKSHVASCQLKNIWEAKNEDEDLFTSMRTHFQPIAVNEMKEEAQVVVEPQYEDGTTFQISSSMEKVYFERSDSGALYLDADKNQKYREFKDACCIEYPGVFWPKFRVCQNEKFCQTDDDVVAEEGEGEMYFPGDEKQVEDCIERDAAAATVITVGGWVTTWPASIWSNDTPHLCNVWGGAVNGDARVAVEEQYIKLKDEILEEGEELLSNLSSMQDLYLNSDDSATAMHSTQAAALINFSQG